MADSPVVPAVESFAAFARRLGVARSTITRAAQAGRLVLATLADGSRGVAILPSLQQWQESRGLRDDVAARHALARGAVAQAAGAATATATAGATAATGIEPQPGSRAQHQATALRWQNALLDLQLQLQQGQQLPRQALIGELQGLGGALRAAVERLIDQTAPRLAAAEPAHRRALLQRELALVRRQLKRDFPRALRRLGAAVSSSPESSP